jgi:hypothetical protein
VCGLVVIWGLVVTGCEASGHPEAWKAFEQMRAEAPSEVGATVDGQKLGISEFESYWRNNRDKSADEVVEAVLDREVAVQKAVDDKVHRSDDLPFVRKKAMVQELLRREIEGELTADDVDSKTVEKIENQMRKQLGRPEGIRASHLLVMLPQDNKGSHRKEDLEVSEKKAKARAKEHAEAIRAALPDEPTLEDLYEARHEFADRVEHPLKIVINAHLSFPAPDARDFNNKRLPGEWMSVVSPFAEAADRMLDEGRAGEVTEPVESPYGWHLVRAEKRLKGKVPEPEALREVAVSRALRIERAKLYRKKFQQWRQGMSIAQYPKAISEASGEER